MANMPPGSCVKSLCYRDEKNVSIFISFRYLVKLELKKTHTDYKLSYKIHFYSFEDCFELFNCISVMLKSSRKHYVFIFLKLNKQYNVITLKCLSHDYIEIACFCSVKLQRNNRELPIPIIVSFNLCIKSNSVKVYFQFLIKL